MAPDSGCPFAATRHIPHQRRPRVDYPILRALGTGRVARVARPRARPRPGPELCRAVLLGHSVRCRPPQPTSNRAPQPELSHDPAPAGPAINRSCARSGSTTAHADRAACCRVICATRCPCLREQRCESHVCAYGEELEFRRAPARLQGRDAGRAHAASGPARPPRTRPRLGTASQSEVPACLAVLRAPDQGCSETLHRQGGEITGGRRAHSLAPARSPCTHVREVCEFAVAPSRHGDCSVRRPDWRNVSGRRGGSDAKARGRARRGRMERDQMRTETTGRCVALGVGDPVLCSRASASSRPWGSRGKGQ